MKIEDLTDGQRISAADYQKLLDNTKADGKDRSRPQLKGIASGHGRMSASEFNDSKTSDGQKNNKFNAKTVYVDGIKFHSAWEAKRYSALKILEKAGEVRNIRLQVPYSLIVNEIAVTTYIADFVYDTDDGEIVEDAKGFVTPEYRIKKSLMKAVFGIEIYETREKQSRYKRKRKKKT